MILGQQTLGRYCETNNVYLTGASMHDIGVVKTLCYNSAVSFSIIFMVAISLLFLAVYISKLFK